MFFSKNSTNPDMFWKTREEELGTPILEKALGQVLSEDKAQPLWGLFYTTSDAVYFQTFQSENWMSMIFSGGKASGRTKDETIRIPKESVLCFELLAQKKPLFRFLRRSPVVKLVWSNMESGVEETMHFEMEGDAEALIASLGS